MSNLKKYNFNFDLTGLQSYTEQRTNQLISESILTGDWASQVQVIPNVKGTQELNVLSSSLTAQAGGCGWAPFSGNSTTFTQKSITSVKNQFQEELCTDDLESFLYKTLFKTRSDIPFEEYLVNYKVQQVKEAIELDLFQATTGTTGYAGFLQLTGTGYTGDNVTYVASASGVTSANIGNSVDDLIASLPDAIAAAKDGIVAMSWSNFRKYTIWVRDKNYFYLANPGDGQTGILHPGSNFMVIPVHGLTGSNRIFTSKKSNFYVGTDLLTDFSSFKMWYSMDNQIVRMKCQYRIGAQTGADIIASNGLA